MTPSECSYIVSVSYIAVVIVITIEKILQVDQGDRSIRARTNLFVGALHSRQQPRVNTTTTLQCLPARSATKPSTLLVSWSEWNCQLGFFVFYAPAPRRTIQLAVFNYGLQSAKWVLTARTGTSLAWSSTFRRHNYRLFPKFLINKLNKNSLV